MAGCSEAAVSQVGRPAAALARLSRTLREVRRSDAAQVQRLFATLGARLASVRRIDIALERTLATRFNSLDYLRTDELGLSRIVADLLNPRAAHGQGDAFLSTLLDRLGDEAPGGRLQALDTASVETRRERAIEGGGRLDISIEIRLPGREPLCIAIENKPFSTDGEGQVHAYLKFLRRRYPGRFLLIYLSPHGGLPSTESLPQDVCTDGLATMSYCPGALLAGNARAALQLRFALTDWLRACSLSCDIDRLRWFLRDTENFCHKTFGGILTTDREHREVRDFILESEDNLRATFAVLDAYPETRNEVIAGFLARLHECVALGWRATAWSLAIISRTAPSMMVCGCIAALGKAMCARRTFGSPTMAATPPRGIWA